MPITLNDDNGNIFAGGDGSDGDLVLQDGFGRERVHLIADCQRMELHNTNGDIISMMGGGANMRLGTNGQSGDIYLYPTDASDIFKRDAPLACGQQLGLRFAKAHGAAAAALLHLAKREEGDAENKLEWQRIEQNIKEHIGLLALLTGKLDLVIFQQHRDLNVRAYGNGCEGLTVFVRAGDQIVAQLDRFNFAFLHLLPEVRIPDLSALGLASVAKERDDQEKGKKDAAPNHKLLHPGVLALGWLLVGIVLVAHQVIPFAIQINVGARG